MGVTAELDAVTDVNRSITPTLPSPIKGEGS